MKIERGLFASAIAVELVQVCWEQCAHALAVNVTRPSTAIADANKPLSIFIAVLPHE